MPAPATTAEFLDLVRKSGVVDESRLQQALGKLSGDSRAPSDPKDLAWRLVQDGALTPFQAEQLLQGKWKRFVIGKYRVMARLGAGGMGQVFLCEHKVMRRRVALKVLPTAKASNPAALERFYREARAVAAMDHPNIVRAFDVDEDEQVHFIVMEYVDGSNLQDLVKKNGPLEFARAAHYVHGTAAALQHAHEQGLVHRDIKPSNILVDRAGVVKLLDLGLARFFFDDEDDLTKRFEENCLGTADYLAPEQIVDSHAADIRADIYSLGGTFYFLLTGQPPFPDGTVPQKLLHHQTRNPTPIKKFRPDAPPGLEALVSRMMDKDPARRFATPADLMAELLPWVQGPVAPPAAAELPAPAPLGGLPNPVSSGEWPRMPSSPTLPAPLAGAGTGAAAAATAGPRTTGPIAPPAPRPTTPSLPDLAGPQSAPEAKSAPADRFWADVNAGVARRSTPLPLSGVERVPLEDPAPRRKWLIPAVAGGALLVAAVATVAALKSGPRVDADPGPHTFYVARADAPTPDATRTVRTLRLAVDAARAGDRIVLLDDLNEPPVRVYGRRPPNGLRGLKVESAPGRVATWTPPTGLQPGSELLAIQDAEDVEIRGLTIAGGGNVAVGLALAGASPGLRVSDVTVTGARTAGVKLSALSGTAERPVELSDLRVQAAEGAEAALLSAPSLKHVRVVNSRFLGPAAAGLALDGAAQGVVVENNEFARFGVGLRASPGPRALPAGEPFEMTVERNTWQGLTAALDVTVPLGGARSVVLGQNLFQGVGEVWKDAPPAGLTARENARDAKTAATPLAPTVAPDEPPLAALGSARRPRQAGYGAR